MKAEKTQIRTAGNSGLAQFGVMALFNVCFVFGCLVLNQYIVKHKSQLTPSRQTLPAIRGKIPEEIFPGLLKKKL
ncbi:hypothetical protein [Flavobacterium croceum]|uniref:hypothetical protein n=1 Tax=Flavobacterium croceum TaxID=370975 RepID=UPI0011AF0242